MIKLSDIIKSGGGNAKINRFINRYVLSKKEKKDIIETIKTNGGEGGSSSKKGEYLYYEIAANNVDAALQLLMITDFRFIDWLYDDNYNKEIIYAETVSQISYEPIVKVRKDYFKIIFSNDGRHGVTINFNDFLNKGYTFEELLLMLFNITKEEFDEILIPLTPEEIIEIESKITIRDPLF